MKCLNNKIIKNNTGNNIITMMKMMMTLVMVFEYLLHSQTVLWTLCYLFIAMLSLSDYTVTLRVEMPSLFYFFKDEKLRIREN